MVAGTGKEGKTKEVVEVVCDKVACESWCVTKKDGVCVCVTKLCVTKKDGVCVCDKVVCERWRVTKKDCVCVTKLCVKVVCVCVKESV